MTVLDAAPLCFPPTAKHDRLVGTLLIVGAVVACTAFLLTLWGVVIDWYYACLIPALFPVSVFFAYLIWLSSQYFRYA